MLRIFNKLFPHHSCSISTQSIPSKAHLYTISIDDHCFFIEIISSSLTSIQEIQHTLINSMNTLFYPNSCSISVTHNITIDNFITNKTQISICNPQHNTTILLFPLDLLIFLSNHLRYTYFYNSDSLYEFHKELYRFKPYIIEPTIWFELSDKDIQNIFYYFISNNLATPKMIALFLKKIPLKNISNLFSNRITREINYELSLLPDTENSELLNTVYYIIENNLIKYLKSNSTSNSVLKQYQILLKYYAQYFLEYSIPSLELTDLDYFNRSIDTSDFNLLLSKLPFQSIISFFKFSPKKNQNILHQILSNNKTIQIQQGIHQHTTITHSKLFIEFLSKLATHFSHIEFEDYINNHVIHPRNWEFIAQEIDLRDLLICIDSLHNKNKQHIPKEIKEFYYLYKKELLIFPNINKQSTIQAQKNYITAIYKLVLLKLL